MADFSVAQISKKFLAATSIAALMIMIGSANAATDDEKKHCVQYDKQPVTLTGTVLVRKINYGKGNDAPPRVAFHFPYLSLTNQFAHGVLMKNPNPSGRSRLPTNVHAYGQLCRVQR
jgi:hypothetical protein